MVERAEAKVAAISAGDAEDVEEEEGEEGCEPLTAAEVKALAEALDVETENLSSAVQNRSPTAAKKLAAEAAAGLLLEQWLRADGESELVLFGPSCGDSRRTS